MLNSKLGRGLRLPGLRNLSTPVPPGICQQNNPRSIKLQMNFSASFPIHYSLKTVLLFYVISLSIFWAKSIIIKSPSFTNEMSMHFDEHLWMCCILGCDNIQCGSLVPTKCHIYNCKLSAVVFVGCMAVPSLFRQQHFYLAHVVTRCGVF